MSRLIHEVRTRNVRVVFPLALDQKPQEDLQVMKIMERRQAL